MELKVLETPDEFADLGAEYQALAATCVRPTPFTSNRWLLAWWRAHADRYSVRVPCLVDDGRLRLVLPLVYEKGMRSRIPMRRVALMGGGWGLTDVIADPGFDRWADALLDWLPDSPVMPWDVLSFGPMEAESTTLGTLISALRARGYAVETAEHPVPYLRLVDGWEPFLETRSRNFRRTVKRKRRAVEENRALDLRHELDPSAATIDVAVTGVSGRSWQGRGGLALAASSEGRRFYQHLSSTTGELRVELTTLQERGRYIAYLIGITQAGTYHAFDTGFDTRYAELSPGLVLHFAALEQLSTRGDVTEFNFGYDASYKERFEPLHRRAVQVKVVRSPLVAGLRRAISRARVLLRA